MQASRYWLKRRGLVVRDAVLRTASYHEGRGSLAPLHRFPVLDEARVLRDLVVEKARRRVRLVRQPVDPRRTRLFRLGIDGFDQRPSEFLQAAHGIGDEQILQVAVIFRHPGRAVEQVRTMPVSLPST